MHLNFLTFLILLTIRKPPLLSARKLNYPFVLPSITSQLPAPHKQRGPTRGTNRVGFFFFLIFLYLMSFYKAYSFDRRCASAGRAIRSRWYSCHRTNEHRPSSGFPGLSHSLYAAHGRRTSWSATASVRHGPPGDTSHAVSWFVANGFSITATADSGKNSNTIDSNTYIYIKNIYRNENDDCSLRYRRVLFITNPMCFLISLFVHIKCYGRNPMTVETSFVTSISISAVVNRLFTSYD